MAIVCESTTNIENLLKNALIQHGIPFEEQYCVYTGGRFSEVKMVIQKGYRVVHFSTNQLKYMMPKVINGHRRTVRRSVGDRKA